MENICGFLIITPSCISFHVAYCTGHGKMMDDAILEIGRMGLSWSYLPT